MGSGDSRNKRRYGVKKISKEISIIPKDQARNLEKKTILPIYLSHVPSLTTLYFLINYMTLKKEMETVHQQSASYL